MSNNTLAQAAIGDSCIVLEIESGLSGLRSRLLSLGLIPGSLVTVLRRAPLGDPLQIRVGGAYLSIRRTEAEAISVELRQPC